MYIKTVQFYIKICPLELKKQITSIELSKSQHSNFRYKILQNRNTAPRRGLTSSRCTTGNSTFAECMLVCRVLKIKHSAKGLFAECLAMWHSAKKCTQQTSLFAECQTLDKERHSAKKVGPNGIHTRHLCRVPTA